MFKVIKLTPGYTTKGNQSFIIEVPKTLLNGLGDEVLTKNPETIVKTALYEGFINQEV